MVLTVVAVLSVAGFLWRQDLQALNALKARKAAQSLLDHPKDISVEALGQGPGSDQRPRRLGRPSLGPVPTPNPNRGSLLNDLQLAFWEHCREGAFPPKDFHPTYAILIHQETRDNVILFSPEQCALETSIHGWDSTYFVIPKGMSRHIRAQLPNL